jgi:hypothetical protein
MLAVIILSTLLLKECKESDNTTHLLELKGQEVVKVKNKLGETTSTIQVLEVQNKDLKKSIKLLNDESYKRILQIEKQHRKALIAATTFNIVTRDTAIGETVSIPTDTVKTDSVTYIYPTYTSTIVKKNKLDSIMSIYEVTAKRDGTKVIATIYNPTDVVTRYEKTTRKNFFDRKNIYTDVHIYNHTSEANDVRSYTTKERKRYTGIKIIVGVAIIETLRMVLKPP